MKTCIVAATALCVPALAVAGRPFVIDDARLTDAGSCQLEVWGESHTDSKEWWAVPACNPTGNLELTLGAGRARSPGEPAGNGGTAVPVIFAIDTFLISGQTFGGLTSDEEINR